MNLTYQDSLPAHFHPQSKVWIYQSDRAFTPTEKTGIDAMLQDFVQQWKTHGTPVKGHAQICFDQFIIFMADESAAGVSGCSTDSSVRIIKNIEQQYSLSLFDRQTLAFVVEEELKLMALSAVDQAIDAGILYPETMYFNNTVLTKQELENNWIIPMKFSWLNNKFNPVTS